MELEKKSNGAFIGLAVIIIILVLGGIYIWQSNKKASLEMPSQFGTLTSQDSAQLNALGQDVNSADPNAGVDVNSVK